jgi:hypothetical protein
MLPMSGAEQTPAGLCLQEREARMDQLKQHLAKAQNRMKLQADKGQSDREFQVGEQVLLKLQPYVQQSVVHRPFPKLAFKFFEPYEVLERIGKAAYKLDLPVGSLIHPIVHVSQLKPFTPNYTPVFQDLTKLVDLSVHDLLPETILHRRLVKKGNQAIPQVMIKWRGLPVESATWEDLNMVKKRFPDAVAWGQATSAAGEGVTRVTEQEA